MIWNRRYNRQDRKSSRRTWNTEILETRSLLSTLSSQPALLPASLPTVMPQYVPDEVLVQFRTDAQSSPLSLPQIALPGTLIEAIPTSISSESSDTSAISRIRLSPGISVNEAIASLTSDPRVIVAEPNWIVRSTAVSDDPSYTGGSMWGTYSSDSPVAAGPVGTTNQWGTHAEQAWRTDVTGSSRILVGVIDEGIQITHPDLNDNIWVNLAETPGDGLDNDGNGYIDDINGWDFANNDNNVNDSTADSHGTHVAGTIGAEGGNGTGVAGVAWDVTIVPLKFMQAGVGTISNAIKAVNYLTDLKTRHGVNVVASNNSWGGGSYSRLLHEAIIRAANAEILFVAAAGNSGTNNDSTIMYPAGYNTTVGTTALAPAAYDSVISVASLTETGTLASTSNFGAASVDIAAPGNSILSTVPGGYGFKSGTSMATPHVTGSIALFASAQTGRVPAAFIRSAVIATATPTSSLAGKTLTGGRLNTFSALQYTAMIELDKSTYGPSQTVNIVACGTNANQDPASPDSLAIQIHSTSETTPLTITLTETGPDTGRFQASLQLALGSPTQDSLLQVAHGDVITALIAGYTVTDTAVVDALAPSLSSITSTPAGASARIAWNTDELASGVVRFGLAPDQLNRTVPITTTALSQNTLLHALDAATAHYFQIETTDLYGNTAFSSVLSFSTTQPAGILFVDDDQNAILETHFRSALTANNLNFDEWNVSAGARLPLAQNLRNYQLVLWTTGGNTTAIDAGLSAAEQSAIAEYLDHGGRIFISGQSILLNSVSDQFRQNYLKVSQFVNDVVKVSHTETGVSGSEITAGIAIAAANVTGLPGLAVDAVQPAPGANGLLLHGLPTVTPAFTGVSYRGNYAAGGFGLVFSTLPFESLRKTAPAPNNQNEFLRRVIQYLNSNIDHGFQITPPTTPTTSEAGTAVTFSIALTTQPSSDVVIPVSSSDSTEGFSSTSSITFTSANWNQSQTVTLTGVDDLIDDGDIAWTAIIAAAVSTDPNYNGLNPADITLVNSDNDTAGISVSTLSGTSTAESGTSVTFTLRLDSQPMAPVTIAIISSDTTEGTVAPASVVFSDTNWDQPQTVTLTGVDDLIDDGDIAWTAIIAAAVSTDPKYNGLNPADITLVNSDNDTAGISVSTLSGSSTAESGTSVTFTLRLDSQPLAPVTIAITSSDTTEGTVAPASVVFSDTNWDQPQTVTLTGVDDLIDDGDIAWTAIIAAAVSTDPNYNGLNPADITLVNSDNDTAGISVSTLSGTSTAESGTSVTFTLRLDSQPLAPVTIAITSSDTTEGTVAPASVVFSAANWNQPQTVTLTGVDDLIDDGDIAWTAIIAAAVSTDPNYNGLNPADISLVNSDNDTAGISVSTLSGTSTAESGTSVTFTLRLDSQPLAPVTIAITSSDTTEGTVAPASVVFSAANWNQPQTVTLTGVDDLIDDGDIAWTAIIAAAVSTDPNYNGLNPADISLVNSDNDTAGISVSTLSGTSTAESGTSVTFTLRLDSQPLAPVTIAITSSDTTEGTVAPASVVFSAANWNQPQTVVITGVDDTIVDGNVTFSVVIAAAVSSDSLYNGLNPADFVVVNTDNDALPSTKFFVVNDDAIDRTFEYDANGQLNEHYAIAADNTASRGIATIVAANRLWVLDSSRRVFVYDNAGALQGAWTAVFSFTAVDVTGIATDGTHIWITDRFNDRIHYFANAATRLSGEQISNASWLVNRSNLNATDIVFGTQGGLRYLWVTDDSTIDRVFRYTLRTDNTSSSSGVVFWSLNSGNLSPTGIALDPSNGSMDIWISDSSSDRVYRYANGRTLTSPLLTSSFSLATAAGNSNPQGIADPPPPVAEASLSGYQAEAPAPSQEAPDAPSRRVTEASPLFRRTEAPTPLSIQSMADRQSSRQWQRSSLAKKLSIGTAAAAAPSRTPVQPSPISGSSHLDLLFSSFDDHPLNWAE